MKAVVAIVVLLAGLIMGYWINEQLTPDHTDKIHVSLDKAVAQSKFNLVKDNYSEFFYLCEQGNRINNWKALMLVAYTFQYGVDAKNIELINKGKNPEGKTVYTINIKEVETLSSEVSFMRAFTLEGALFKNQEKLISESKDDVIQRRLFLSELRLYSSDGSQIMDELKSGITTTVINLASALGENIVIDGVTYASRALSIKHMGAIKYQCGDINPLFVNEGFINERVAGEKLSAK